MSQMTFSAIRSARPLILCLTNFVTVNDVANALLAVGARPVMSRDPSDAAELAASASALLLNIGTLDTLSTEAMLAAGHVASVRGIPIVLDPVGAGATSIRTSTALKLLGALHISAIRCNASELAALSAYVRPREGVAHSWYAQPDQGDCGAKKFGSANCAEQNSGYQEGGNPFTGSPHKAQGVDAIQGESIAPADLRAFSAAHNCLIAVTGAIDFISSDVETIENRTGRPEMAYVTGTGCQLSAICAAALAVNPSNPLEALASAVSAYGAAGETAWKNMRPGDGNAMYRNRIIDALYNS